jgi:hypothetical protein
MADVPDNLTLKRHRDLDGMYRSGIWIRRGVLGVIGVFCLLGLVNRFGQATSTRRVVFPAGSLSVTAPSALRGGDLWSAVFTVTASSGINQAVLVLDPGWANGMAINTIEPSPVDETSRDGQLEFTLGPIRAGHSFTVFMQFQVNPTTVAWQRRQDVQVDDGNLELATLPRTVTVYP